MIEARQNLFTQTTDDDFKFKLADLNLPPRPPNVIIEESNQAIIDSMFPPLKAQLNPNFTFRKTLSRKNSGIAAMFSIISDAFLTLWLSVKPKYRIAVYSGLLWLGEKIYGPASYYGTQRLPLNLYVKHRGLLPESLATQYIYEKTSVPVPKVLDIIPIQNSDMVFMLMTRLPGVMIGEAIRHMTPDEISLLISDIKSCLLQWRSFEAPSQEAVTGFLGAPLRSFRVKHDGVFGPFQSKQEFYEYTFTQMGATDEEWKKIRLEAARSHSKPHRICFTHGDFRFGNILVHNKRLSGIIDWECCGWMPEYWEYTTARYFAGLSPVVQPIIEELFSNYETELEVERFLWEYIFPW